MKTSWLQVIILANTRKECTVCSLIFGHMDSRNGQKDILQGSNDQTLHWDIRFGSMISLETIALFKRETDKVGALSWENLLLPYATIKGPDQPAHMRSLISAFVVRCLDSMRSKFVKSKISRFLTGRWSWAGRFESYLVANPWRQVFLWRGSIKENFLQFPMETYVVGYS